MSEEIRAQAPPDLWLHWMDEQVDAPFEWQLSERRIDKHSVRYVLADVSDKRIAELEAARIAAAERFVENSNLSREYFLARIAELEADLENVQKQRDQDVLDCQKIVASKHEIMDRQKQSIAELKEREQKYIKALSILMPECEMNNMTQPAIAALGDLVDDIPAEKRALRWECKLG